MSTLEKAVGVVDQTDYTVSSCGDLTAAMPVSLLPNQDSIMCDSGSESMGFSDHDNDIQSNLKDTLVNIKAMNGEPDSLDLSNEKSFLKLHESNGVDQTEKLTKHVQNSSQEERIVIDDDDADNDESKSACEKSSDDILLQSNVEGSDDKYGIDEEEELVLLMDVDEDLSEAKSKTAVEDNDDNVTKSETDSVVKEECLPTTDKEVADEDKTCPNKKISTLDESDNESSSKSAVDDNFTESSPEDESTAKAATCNEEESLLESEKTKTVEGVSNSLDQVNNSEGVSNSLDQDNNSEGVSNSLDQDNNSVDINPTFHEGVNSPISHCDSSRSSTLRDQEKQVDSDSESVTSNSSRKHPLLIGNNVKYSFKGIMKTAVTRVSNDSDSAKSSPRREDDSLPPSPKPDSSTGTHCLEDVNADSSTTPDNRNLFEKLGLLTDKDNSSASRLEDSETDSCSEGPARSLGVIALPASGVEAMETDTSEKIKGNHDTVSGTSETQMPDGSTETMLTDISSEASSLEKKTCAKLNDSLKTTENYDQSECKTETPEKTLLPRSKDTSEKSDVSEESKSDIDQLDCGMKLKTESVSLSSSNAEKSQKESMKIDSKLLNVSVKTDTDLKCEIPKTEVNTESSEQSRDSETNDDSESLDRKRSANEDCEDSKPKRSRLDFVIGKLGSQIGISVENIKCDEQMSDSDVDESCKTSTDSAENPSEEVTSEDDESSHTQRLTEESLDVLIREKIKGILEQQRDVLTKQFQAKIDELQASNESWKAQSKELHRRACELMTQQQRQNRQRAARISGQRRNVGIQVGEQRINNLNLQQSTSKPPAVVTSPVASVSLLNSPAASTQMVKKIAIPVSSVASPTVKSLLNSNRIGQLNSLAPPVSAAAAAAKTKHSTAPSPTIQTLVKVIDLTSDEDTNSQTTMASPGTQTFYRPVSTAPGVQPPTRILLTSATGAPIVANPAFTGSTRPRQPGVQYQYLYAPANPNLRAGNLVTLVSPRAGTPSTVQAALTSPAPPQLTRPSQPLTRPIMATTTVVRAPPPLQTAPNLNQKAKPTPPMPEVKKTVESVPEKKVEEKSINIPAHKHPAPFPPLPASQNNTSSNKLPPKPWLKISRVSQGIVLSWNLESSVVNSEIASYQLFAYQETSMPAESWVWKKVGDVKALPLPMACTLTQFQEGNKYHFAVRAVDVQGRVSVFSDPCTIHLVAQSSK